MSWHADDLGSPAAKRNRPPLLRLLRHRRLGADPVDQFVELDRLLGGDKSIVRAGRGYLGLRSMPGRRKSVFTGGLMSCAGGSG